MQVRSDPEVDRFYRVLAHLDLGLDAANLYDPSLPTADWAAELRQAYQGCPARLTAQFLPLWGHAAERLLNDDLLPGLRTPAGARLRVALLHALALVPTRELALPDTAALAARLPALRQALWEKKAPPPLLLLHAPALGVHARAVVRRDGLRVVAADLAQPLALIQVFHEECHPISDPGVKARGRDTRVGEAGHASHVSLERAAVALGARVLAGAAPDLLPDYDRWRARYGV
jgi:hypothetical protein